MIDDQDPVTRERWSRPAICAGLGVGGSEANRAGPWRSSWRLRLRLVPTGWCCSNAGAPLGRCASARSRSRRRLLAMAGWVQGPIIQAAAAQAEAMAAGDGAGLDQAADDWAALTMWLHAAECSAPASRAHGLAGSRRGAAASASRAEAFLDHCDGPRPTGLT